MGLSVAGNGGAAGRNGGGVIRRPMLTAMSGRSGICIERKLTRIKVAARGKVILRNTVRSWAEREESERVAWAAPGFVAVDDQITVRP